MVFPGLPVTTARRAVLVLHGGAGNIRQENLDVEHEARRRAGLEAALREGYTILRERSGSALDAVEAAVRRLEDDPLFNAGRGSVLTHDFRAEMDAAIMDGASGRAGAVTGLTTVRNPVTLARAVMERSPFVLLAGAGAEAFAETVRVERADPSYFRTEERITQLQALQAQEAAAPPQDDAAGIDRKFGTVGAVAVDRHGHVAAATSTGGMPDKRYGRVGDSPVIGAGTWADDATCAVSCTGHGEFFLRFAAAHDVAARIAYLGESVFQAADVVIHEKLKGAGGYGGLIAIDRQGNAALPFNTVGMYRGYITEDGSVSVAIFRDE